MTTPVVGVPYTFDIALFDVANPGRLKKTPTLEAGDFAVSVDNGPLTNLVSLPVEIPANSGIVKITLAGSEVGAKTSVLWIDADFEWGDGHYFFDAST